VNTAECLQNQERRKVLSPKEGKEYSKNGRVPLRESIEEDEYQSSWK